MIRLAVLFVALILVFAMIPSQLVSAAPGSTGKPSQGEGIVKLANGITYADYTFRDSTKKIISDGNSICKNIPALSYDMNNAMLKFEKQSYHAEESVKLYAVLHYSNTGNTTKHFLCVHLTSPSNAHGIMIVLKEKTADALLKNKNWHYYQSMGYAALSSVLNQTDYVYGPNLLTSQKDTLVNAELSLNGRHLTAQAMIGSAIPSVSGGRGQTMTYNPSLLPSTTTRYVCTNDIDRDYVCDEWENSGGPLQISINGATYVGPACGTGTSDPYCPSPSGRDIFVQVDHFTGFSLDPSFVSDVTAAFKNKSFYLHLQQITTNVIFPLSTAGLPTVPVNGITFPNNVAAGGTACTELSCNPVDFDVVKNTFFATDKDPSISLATNQDLKSQVFHYALFGNMVSNDPQTSGVGEIWGNDLLVSLGTSGFDPASKDEQEGTFMHELGHNLNLNHGGNDAINCKPNYLSVMNYLYQFPDLVPTRKLDYSRSVLGPTTATSLVESNLNEIQGLIASNPAGQYAAYGVPTNLDPSGYRVAPTGSSINWNIADGLTRLTTADVNYVPRIGGCPSSPGQTLSGFTDWNLSALKFNFESAPSFASGMHMIPDIGSEVSASDLKMMKHAHTYKPQFYVQNLPSSDFAPNDPVSSKSEINLTFNKIHNDIESNDISEAISRLLLAKTQVQSDITNGTSKNNTLALIDDVGISFKKDTNYVTITFDKQWYVQNQTATITVIDPDANRDASSADQIFVNVSSGSDPAGITVRFQETGMGTGIFEGQVKFVSGPTQAISGIHGFSYNLHTSSDDVIHVSYDGAFDGYTLVVPGSSI